MQRFRQYWHTAWYAIRQNRIYAVFCVLGTALTFVFITLLLQMAFTVMGNTPPFVNADRTITVAPSYVIEGQWYGVSTTEAPGFQKLVKEAEKMAMTKLQWGLVVTSNQFRNTTIMFTNADFWSVYQFDFLAGHPYTERDVADKRLVAVVSEAFVKANYPKGDAVGREFSYQEETYRITGVIADYPRFYTTANIGCDIFIPYTTERTPINSYNYRFLFPETMNLAEAKQNLSNAIVYFLKNKNVNIDSLPEQLQTEKERNLQKFGGEMILYGVGGILLLLLVVPALNIITLNIANANKRSEEIALRRAIGATRLSAFWLLISENFILVVAGALLGVALTYPVAYGMGNLMQDNGGHRLIAGIGLGVIVCVLFLCIVFTLLSGGLPAWMASRQRIAETLKGGAKW